MNLKYNQNISIQKYNWLVQYTLAGEIIFLFEMPYEYQDPLWYDWNDDNEYKNFVTNVDFKIPLPSITIIRKLVAKVIQIVNMKKLKFFFFQANTKGKSRLYKILSQKYLMCLNGKWKVQMIDDYFYFNCS